MKFCKRDNKFNYKYKSWKVLNKSFKTKMMKQLKVTIIILVQNDKKKKI